MQIKVFTIPTMAADTAEEEVSKFLRSHRVLTLDRVFTAENGEYR